jgi:hypothetical protein
MLTKRHALPAEWREFGTHNPPPPAAVVMTRERHSGGSFS